ncbi:MAG: preprotein translocase subunit SecE [bacterium]|nr:preprotein translocase subunit SecE [Mycoplasmatota bacterium]MDD6757455.1 preprotein translocase subunit SecE [bacterium]
MAEVRKRKEVENYKIDETQFHKNEKNKQSKNSKKKENHKDTLVKSSSEEKKSLWVRFRIFCHGVKSETKKVHWPTKKDMLKYSVATVLFIVFCSLFFYVIDIIFALVQSLFR